MATSNATYTRRRIKQIIEGIEGINDDRIVIGLKDWKPTDEFLQNMLQDGPFVLIRGTEFGDTDMQSRQTEATIEVVLFYGYPDDADNDFCAHEDLLSEILNELFTPTNWAEEIGHEGEAGWLPYLPATVERDDEYNKKPRIIETTINLQFKGPLFGCTE